MAIIDEPVAESVPAARHESIPLAVLR